MEGDAIKVFFTGEEWRIWRKGQVSSTLDGAPANGYFNNEFFLGEKDKIMFFDKLKELQNGNYLTDCNVEDKWPRFDKKHVPTKTAHD